MSSGEAVRGDTTRPNKTAESDRSRLGDVSQILWSPSRLVMRIAVIRVADP
jgi:hypothetical protein